MTDMKDSVKEIDKDNRGLSLIEIIIVISIMAFIGAVFLLSTSVATNKHVNSCAAKLTSSLEQTRNLVLGKRGGYIEFWQNAGDNVYCQMNIDGQPYGDEVSIGHSGLTITVNTYNSLTGTSGSYTLSGHGRTRVTFSRSNGSVKDDEYVTSIVITNNYRSITISIDKFTGRVTQGPIVDT